MKMLFKRIPVSLFLFLSLFISLGASVAQAKISVGVVDIQKILLAIDEGKGVRGKLEEFYKQKQELLKKEEEKFKDLQKKYEKQKAVLNESARGTKEKELRELYVSIQDQTMGYQKELQEMETTLKRPLIDKIKGLVEMISKKASMDMTFEAGSSSLVYAESQKDLTEDVINAYNKQYPAKK